MNCPECFRVVFVTQSKCACGAVLSIPKAVKQEKQETRSYELMPQVSAKLSEVSAFVTLYRTKNPKATVREASIEYLKQNGVLHKLPAHLRAKAPEKSFDDVMDDYRMSEEDAA